MQERRKGEGDREGEIAVQSPVPFHEQLCCWNIFLVNHAIFQPDRKHPLSKLHRLISSSGGGGGGGGYICLNPRRYFRNAGRVHETTIPRTKS